MPFRKPPKPIRFVFVSFLDRLMEARRTKPRLRHRVVVVGLSLASFSDETGKCWPSRAAISAQTGIPMRKISEDLAEMEKRGLIRRNVIPGETSIYTLIA